MTFQQLHLDWVAGGLALVASYYRADRDRIVIGWYLSVIVNLMFGFINVKMGLYGLAVLAAVNVGISIKGIVTWSNKKLPHKKTRRLKV